MFEVVALLNGTEVTIAEFGEFEAAEAYICKTACEAADLHGCEVWFTPRVNAVGITSASVTSACGSWVITYTIVER